MTKNITALAYLATIVIVIVGMDLLFFRHKFRERLIANIGLVLVFAAFYSRFQAK